MIRKKIEEVVFSDYDWYEMWLAQSREEKQSLKEKDPRSSEPSQISLDWDKTLFYFNFKAYSKRFRLLETALLTKADSFLFA